ncbi:MAG: ATP-binding protein [Pyrinomonadaceae bacterium]
MSFSLSRFVLLLATTGLCLGWVLLAVVTFSVDRQRLFIIVSGLVLFFLLTILAFSFGGLFRYFRKSSDSARLAFPASAPNSAAKHTSNEIEFVSQTLRSVVEKLQTKQKELNELHAKLGERAASAEAFSQNIVACLPSGLIAFDLKGLVRIINEPAMEIFGLDRCLPVLSSSYQDLFKHNPAFLQIISDSIIRNTFIARCELDYQTHIQKKKRLGLTIAPLAVASEIAGVLCLVADITEINQLKEQIALQRNLESLGLMSAGLAHEFKNALAALHVYAQFLNRLSLDQKGHEAAAALIRELRGLTEMVTAFLNFSRPQPLSLTTVSLAELIQDCSGELQAALPENSFKIIIQGDFATCQADSILLRQVINNLLFNAFESVAANSISNQSVIVNGSLEIDDFGNQWAKIEVEDNGGGIKTEDLPFVFVPFFTTKQKGHGIGLAVSHRIITQHGGTLTAGNSSTGGAIFTLRLKT